MVHGDGISKTMTACTLLMVSYSISPVNAAANSIKNFQEYGAGRMLTGEVKKHLVEVLSELVERHRKARSLVTDEVSN